MQKPLTIKLLKGLPLAAVEAGERSAFLRALETFCYMKAMWPDRPMPNNPDAINLLAAESKRSTKTIKRRLAYLQSRDLVRAHHLRGYDCLSWRALARDYAIPHQHFYHIKNSAYVHLYDIIDKKVESEKQKQCSVAIRNRVKSNRYTQEIIEEVSGSRFYPEALAEHQLNYLLSGGRSHAHCDDAQYVLSTHYTQAYNDREKEKKLRGDTALCSRSLTKLYGYSGHGTMAYKKRKWQRLGLCNVFQRVFTIPNGIYTTKASRKHRLGFIRFNTANGLTELVMPDLISDNPLGNLDHRYERIQDLLAQLKLQAVQDKLRAQS
ncbi:MAG: hypothetical protein KIS94_05690 [Chitinophagales bacterium]|nr:hypothetical protein [Chitinophagales bacterium]